VPIMITHGKLLI